MGVIFLINILVIFGIYVIFSERMLLSPVREYLVARINKKYLKPFILCPPCMSSIWGTVGFFFTDYPIWGLPIYVLSLCGAIYLIIEFIPE